MPPVRFGFIPVPRRADDASFLSGVAGEHDHHPSGRVPGRDGLAQAQSATLCLGSTGRRRLECVRGCGGDITAQRA
jgi:hypothetical protein